MYNRKTSHSTSRGCFDCELWCFSVRRTEIFCLLFVGFWLRFPVCPLFCAYVRLELLLFNQYRQNLLTIFVSHESWPNFLLCYFCFQFQYHQKLANCATFTTQFCKQFQNDNSVTNMALKLKQKRLSGQCHLNFRISFLIVNLIKE